MKVLVVTNKWWECDPALAALINDNSRPANSLWPTALAPSRPRPETVTTFNVSPQPRALLNFHTFTAEVWCISDLLEGYSTDQQSSSERKAGLLGKIFQGPAPDLVIAVGTAATPDMTNRNGGVVIGSQVFMHNGQPNGSNPDSNLNLPTFDQLIPSTLSDGMFNKLNAVNRMEAEKRFLPVPLNPSPKPELLFDRNSVSLGTVNVSKTADYAVADLATLSAFQSLGTTSTPVSVETTHGLIRSQSNSPFIFVSGIVNRFQQFGVDVASRSYAQNTAGAHNAGIAVAWLLDALDS